KQVLHLIEGKRKIARYWFVWRDDGKDPFVGSPRGANFRNHRGSAQGGLRQHHDEDVGVPQRLPELISPWGARGHIKRVQKAAYPLATEGSRQPPREFAVLRGIGQEDL